jgi:rhodanese-related sulfurtransferase/plastocyanin
MKAFAMVLMIAVWVTASGSLIARAEEEAPVVGRTPVDLYSPQRLVEAIQAGEKIIFLDVREPEEFAENHIPGAVNIPERLLRERRSEIPREGVLIPYCNMDFRGYVAVDTLRSLGFDDVGLMQERGIEGWRSQGLPTMDAKQGIDDRAAWEQLRSVSAKDLLGDRYVETVEPTGITHQVSMSVSEWYFDPNDLEIGAGDTLEIEVRSEKGNHFFILPDYEIQTHVPEGETRRVSFVADKPGEFRFGSCEWDGGALQVMKGRLRVR